LGNNTVLIPWTAFGSSLDTQLAIIQLNDGVTVPSGDSEAAVFDPLTIHELFNYGSFNSSKGYNSAKYRIYNINEIKESKDGVAPIVFFTTSNANSEYYLFNPETDADSNKVKDFTLKTLLEKGGYKSIALYADIDPNGKPYCAGIAIAWAQGSATTAASNYYAAQKNAYDQSHATAYDFTDIPTKTNYDAKIKQINSMYMSKLIQTTCDKMRGAFEQSERWIHILWTDIDSKYPDKVRDKWLQTSSLTFDGDFTTSLHPESIKNSNGLAAAYNTLMIGHHINDAAINTSALSNGAKVDAHYIWAYTAYNDVTGGSTSSGDRLAEPDKESSCGIAVYLGQAGATESVVNSAKNRLVKILKTIHDKEDPAKKKK
jgi:hypothetical protein